jgi:hypothetical protein
MRLNKLLGALGNLDKIAEGIKNKIFKKADVEAVAKLRWMECKVCPLLDNEGSSCAVPRTKPCCSDCGCSISLKIRSMSSDCPKGRWDSIMTPEMEHELKQQVMLEEKAKHDKRMEEIKKKELERVERLRKKYRDANNI